MMKLKIGLSSILSALLLVFILTSLNATEEKASQPNILFISVDDLRPELNVYGQSHIRSPNIDRLASEGILFNRAYANVPVCGASRASLMTGARPTRNRFLTYYTYAEKDYPEATTLPEHFRNNGYYTVSNSKVFHHADDSEEAWDEIWMPNNPFLDYKLDENIRLNNNDEQRGPAFEMAEVPDTSYIDGETAQKALQDLERLPGKDQPFFLAVGFLRPHLPFNVPKKYWDLYNPEEIKFPQSQYRSESTPDQAFHNSGELRQYHGIPPEGRLPDSLARTLIHGYYAGVSYIDAQVGLLMEKLDELGLREDTIIVLWGDHGWNLREHGLWCKHANFETSLHVPLIMKIPGYEANTRINEVVELVDIYPSLAELAGLEKPDHLEGRSLIPLLSGKDESWDNIAVSKFHDGLTLIKDHLFYTEWSESGSEVEARMLFDHKSDPMEMNNLAVDSSYVDLTNELSNQMKQERGNNFESDANLMNEN